MNIVKILFFSLLLNASIFAAEYRITDFGAIANDGQSDTVAMRNTLKEVERNCGGTIVIPHGEFLLTDTISTAFYGEDACGFIPLAIHGETGAVVRVSVGYWNTAFLLTYVNTLQVKNVTFLGMEVLPSHTQFTDAKNVFYVTGVETADFTNCNFYNLAVQEAILRVGAVMKFNVEHAQFNGNAAYYSSNLQEGGAYILGDNDGYGNAWSNITVRNSSFIDYINYQRRWLTKTPAGMSGSYIRTKQPSLTHANAIGRLIVMDSTFDEGSHTAIVANNTPYVEIRGVGVNLNSTSGSTAVRLTNVKHAILTQNVADWSQNGRPFLTTQNVNFLKLSGLELRAGNRFWHNLGNTNMQIEYCAECSTKPYVPNLAAENK